MLLLRNAKAEHRSLVHIASIWKICPFGSNHPKWLGLVESERQRAALDPDHVCHFEHGFETDTFLANIALLASFDFLSAAGDATYCLHILCSEADLITTDEQKTVFSINDLELRQHIRSVFVVVTVLNEFEDEMSGFAVQLFRKPIVALALTRELRVAVLAFLVHSTDQRR